MHKSIYKMLFLKWGFYWERECLDSKNSGQLYPNRRQFLTSFVAILTKKLLLMVQHTKLRFFARIATKPPK